MPKATKLWIRAGIAVAALVIGHGAIASWMLNSAVVERARAAGWHVTMGHALSLYPGQVDIGALEATSNDSPCSMRVAELDARIALASLLRDPLRLGDVQVEGLSIMCVDGPDTEARATRPRRALPRAVHASMFGFVDGLPTTPANSEPPAPAALLIDDITVELAAVRYQALSISGPWTVMAETATWNGQTLTQLSGVSGQGSVSMSYADTLITNNLNVVVKGAFAAAPHENPVPASVADKEAAHALRMELQAAGIALAGVSRAPDQASIKGRLTWTRGGLESDSFVDVNWGPLGSTVTGADPEQRWHCSSPVRMSVRRGAPAETIASPAASPSAAVVRTSVALRQTAKIEVSAERCTFAHPAWTDGDAELSDVLVAFPDVSALSRNPGVDVPFSARVNVNTWPIGEANIAGALQAGGALVVSGSELQSVRVQRGAFETARVSWPDDVSMIGGVEFHGTADLSATGTTNTWAGTARLSGPDAAPLFRAEALGALPRWVSEKFDGLPFEFQSDFKITPQWLVADDLRLKRGSILVSGWLMRGREGRSPGEGEQRSPDQVGALVMNYAGLAAGVELYGERTTLIHALTASGSDTSAGGSEWLAERRQVLPQQAWRTAVPLP